MTLTAKVPFDVAGWKRSVSVLEVLVERVSIWTIDIDLRKHRELGPITLSELLDLHVAPRLLQTQFIEVGQMSPPL